MVRRFVDEQEDQEEYQGGQQYGVQARRKRYRASDFNRYQYDPPSLQNRQDAQRGKLWKVYREGESNQRGIVFSFCRSKRQFQCLELLLNYINEKLNKPPSVNYLFRWPENVRINSVDEILDEDNLFVVSSKKTLKKLDIAYGGISCGGGRPSAISEKGGRDSYDSRGTYGSKPSSMSSSENSMRMSRRPIMIKVINNLNRERQVKIAINPHTKQNFEEILEQITNCIDFERPPVTALYSTKPPFTKVDAYNKLFREIKKTDTFLACGSEEPRNETVYGPQTPRSKRFGSPSRNGNASQTPRHQPRRSIQHSPNGYDDGENGRFREPEEDEDRYDTYRRHNGDARYSDRSPVRGQPQRQQPRGREQSNRQSYNKQQQSQQQQQRRSDPRKPAPRQDYNNHTSRQKDKDDDDDDRRSDKSDSAEEERQRRLILKMETPREGLDDDIEY